MILSVMKKKYIYGLYDPRNPDVLKYIGSTSYPQRRLRMHRSSNRKDSPLKKYWLDALIKDGLFPQMRILECVPVRQAPDRESFWINFFGLGNLLNEQIPNRELYRECEISGVKTLAEQVAELESSVITKALAIHQGKISPTAKYLGISRPSLYDKIATYKITAKPSKSEDNETDPELNDNYAAENYDRIVAARE